MDWACRPQQAHLYGSIATAGAGRRPARPATCISTSASKNGSTSATARIGARIAKRSSLSDRKSHALCALR